MSPQGGRVLEPGHWAGCLLCECVHTGRTHLSRARRRPGEEGAGWGGCCVWRPGDRQLVREGLWVTRTPSGCNAANSPFSAFAEGQEGRVGPGRHWAQLRLGCAAGEAQAVACCVSSCRPQLLPLHSPLGLWPLLSPGLSELDFILITQAVESDLLGSNLGSAVS